MWTVTRIQQPVHWLMMLSQQLSDDAERLTAPVDVGRALDRVTYLRHLAVSVGPPVGAELLEHVTVVASVAARLRVLLGAHESATETGAAGCLGPVETAASLDLAAETLSLSARLALSLARRLRHERLHRVLATSSAAVASWTGRVVVVGSVAVDQRWAWLAGLILVVAPVAGVVAPRPARMYAVMVAVASVTLVPHAASVLVAVAHVLTELRAAHRDVLTPPARRRETVETPPRIRKGHRHVVRTR